MALRLTGSMLLKLLREVNLEALKKEAEAPARIVLHGNPELVRKLQLRLGTQPWMSSLTDLSSKRKDDVLVSIYHASEQSESVNAALSIVVGQTLPDVPKYHGILTLDETTDLEEVAASLLKAIPTEQRLSLARHVPLLRPAYARWLIDQTSSSNAVFAASAGLAGVVPLLNIPLNVADIIVLTKNQLIMAYKLALAEGKSGKPNELMKEVLSVLGGGLLFRQIARELVGLIPVWGILPKVVVAYGGTYVIGETVHLWASEGKTASAKQMARFYKEARAKAQYWIAEVKKRGTKRALQQDNAKTKSAQKAEQT